MALVEGTTRDALGGIVIKSRMRMVPDRHGYEKAFFPSVEVGLPGWERAHSQGKITGVESRDAIRYAPSEVNQQFQRLGVEGFIRDLFKEKVADVDIWLTTVTYTHPMTLRLKEIQYRVDVVIKGKQHTLFEASIEVQDQRMNPRVTPNVRARLPREDWLPLVTNAAAAKRTALLELTNLWQKIKNQCDLYKGEHLMQRDLATKTFGGVVTNLFNTAVPPLDIWDPAYKRLENARAAFSRHDLKAATKETMMARAHFLFALKKYSIWKDKIESAGTKAQIAIGAVAVLAVLAACGAYAASARGAAAGASVAGTATATEQAAMQIKIATQNFEATLQAIEALSAAQEAAALAEYEATLEVYAMTL